MSLGRVLLFGTAAIGSTFIALKPEARQKVKQMVALQLHKIGNALDPQGPPPMWTDEEEQEVAPTSTANQDESVDSNDEPEEEDRTIQGFKVKK
jgi:hypothetical protein